MIDTQIGSDGIAVVTLNRADAKNAVSIGMWQALSRGIESLGDAPRLLMVRSAVDGMFCPGADIKEFAVLMDSADARKAMRQSMQEAVDRLERARYPTLAVVNGPCVGAGVSIAMACDLRIAADKARFGVTPAKLGLLYSKDDVRRLLSVVGSAATKDLLFTGRIINAEEAKDIGMVQHVVEAGALDQAALDLAQDIASKSGQTHSSVKHILRALSGLESFDDEAHDRDFEDAFVSEDAAPRIEAMLRYLNKSP